MSIVSEAALVRARGEVGWTTHRLSIVQDLYNSGKTAAQIACLIGGVTRNAVIGKIHRTVEKKPDFVDPSRMARRTFTAPTTRPALRMRPEPKLGLRPPVPPEKQRPVAPAPIIDATIPGEQRKTLPQLTNTCCKWPVGDPGTPDFFFCGMPKPDNGRPYCPAHELRAKGAEPRQSFKPPLRGPRAINFMH
ncbi:GcrA family cell cycle regulator [Bradyrhizobium sp. SZCCHNRI1058]|uniref:GcrA family cell cycle regulator n=1 Tax=Bradyrhizobium sp. SZCCHNRI1058 TaxID=3057279 RepID=UPI0029161E4A|nr:GcrA family cell cycle regulator [Bradyrhizobium sp. SZCCHNRI1058]